MLPQALGFGEAEEPGGRCVEEAKRRGRLQRANIRRGSGEELAQKALRR